MKKTTQSKSKTKTQTKHGKPKQADGLLAPQAGASRTVTITLNEPAYLLTKIMGEYDGYKSVEQCVLADLAESVGAFVAEGIDKDEVQAIFGVLSDGDKKHRTRVANAVSRAMSKPTTREIVLKLNEKAWRILDGHVASEGWDNAEHMILTQTSSLLAQSTGDEDEKEYARIFGLKVDKKGRTHLL